MTTPAEQPSIANVLSVTFNDPIPDDEGWAVTFDDPSDAPAPPKVEMFAGRLGWATQLIAPHVPWDPVAYWFQQLVMIGSYCGYDLTYPESAKDRHGNLYAMIVGGTGTGKGSSLEWATWGMNLIDSSFVDARFKTGVGSAEGMITFVTDDVWGRDKQGNDVIVYPGEPDKRLMYVDEEFSGFMAKMGSRDGLETMMTAAWDSGRLETGTKAENRICAKPHISLIGHITPRELLARMDTRLLTNGFKNRILDVAIRPTQVIDDEVVRPDEVDGLSDVLKEIGKNVAQVRDRGRVEFELDNDARELLREFKQWFRTQSRVGATRDLSARGLSNIFKIALILAAVDGQTVINGTHFAAARAAWAYSMRCTIALFGHLKGSDDFARFTAAWRDMGMEDLTDSDLYDVFNRRFSALRKERLIAELQQAGIAERVEYEREDGQKGPTRRGIRYVAPAKRDLGVPTW